MNPFSRLASRFLKMKSLPVLFVLFIAWLIFLIASPDVFSQPTIYLSHFRNIPAKVILALGLTLVVTAGEIDLSFGSIICFSGFVLCWCINVIGPALDAVTPGLGALAPWIGLVAAVGSGVFIGHGCLYVSRPVSIRLTSF